MLTWCYYMDGLTHPCWSFFLSFLFLLLLFFSIGIYKLRRNELVTVYISSVGSRSGLLCVYQCEGLS